MEKAGNLMIKMVSLKCPECNANLELEEGRKQCFCQYCGTKIMLDDGSCTYTHVYIDKTREKELELEAKKLGMELEKEKANEKWKKFSIISVIVAFALAVITFFIVKYDFNITFNFALLLLGSIIAIARVAKKESLLGLFLISLIFSCACIMFMMSYDDFDITFTITLVMAIVLNVVASVIRAKKR